MATDEVAGGVAAGTGVSCGAHAARHSATSTAPHAVAMEGLYVIMRLCWLVYNRRQP